MGTPSSTESPEDPLFEPVFKRLDPEAPPTDETKVETKAIAARVERTEGVDAPGPGTEQTEGRPERPSAEADLPGAASEPEALFEPVFEMQPPSPEQTKTPTLVMHRPRRFIAVKRCLNCEQEVELNLRRRGTECPHCGFHVKRE